MVPEKLTLDDHIFSLKFIPQTNLLGAGLVSGQISIYGLKNEQTNLIVDLNYHTGACRYFDFWDQSSILSLDENACMLYDLDRGVVSRTYKMSEQPNSGVLIDKNLFAVGTDVGGIYLFDTRCNQSVMQFGEQEDQICKLLWKDDRLFACSTDGYLGVYSVRQGSSKYSGKLYALSDQLEDEMTCMTFIKSGSRLVMGGLTGFLNIFTDGDFGDFRDRLRVAKKQSVDCVEKFDESLVFAGTSAGNIYVAHFFPNHICGMIGKHDETVDEVGIEHLALSGDSKILASSSSEIVRFWSTSDAKDLKKVDDVKGVEVSTQSFRSNFFADMDSGGS